MAGVSDSDYDALVKEVYEQTLKLERVGPWFVTHWDADEADKADLSWTVSRNPDYTGWETDCAQPRYGLSYSDAKELADGANLLYVMRRVVAC